MKCKVLKQGTKIEHFEKFRHIRYNLVKSFDQTFGEIQLIMVIVQQIWNPIKIP